MKNFKEAGLDQFRITKADNFRSPKGSLASLPGEQFGMFVFRKSIERKPTFLVAIAADDYPPDPENNDPGSEWEHVSVSVRYEKGKKMATRTPTWEEMEFIKRLFWEPDEVCFQLHVAESNHISYHPHCLHIWRKPGHDVPLPPPECVGPTQ